MPVRNDNSPLQAIRRTCYICRNFSWQGVRECDKVGCPLYHFRFGKRPATIERQKKRLS